MRARESQSTRHRTECLHNLATGQRHKNLVNSSTRLQPKACAHVAAGARNARHPRDISHERVPKGQRGKWAHNKRTKDRKWTIEDGQLVEFPLPAAKIEFRLSIDLVALLADAIQFCKLGNVVISKTAKQGKASRFAVYDKCCHKQQETE